MRTARLNGEKYHHLKGHWLSSETLKDKFFGVWYISREYNPAIGLSKFFSITDNKVIDKELNEANYDVSRDPLDYEIYADNKKKTISVGLTIIGSENIEESFDFRLHFDTMKAEAQGNNFTHPDSML